MDGNLKSFDEVAASLQRFSLVDYCVFIAMLACCSFVGLYFAWSEHRKQKQLSGLDQQHGRETDNYLMGERNMSVFPVGEHCCYHSFKSIGTFSLTAMSLVATFVSGITLLGTGTEIYLYGTQYCFIFIAIFVSAIFLHFIIIPVLHEIQVTSAYEV